MRDVTQCRVQWGAQVLETDDFYRAYRAHICWKPAGHQGPHSCEACARTSTPEDPYRLPGGDEVIYPAAEKAAVTPAVVAKALPHVNPISARARVVAEEQGWSLEAAQKAIDKGWIQ